MNLSIVFTTRVPAKGSVVATTSNTSNGRVDVHVSERGRWYILMRRLYRWRGGYLLHVARVEAGETKCQDLAATRAPRSSTLSRKVGIMRSIVAGLLVSAFLSASALAGENPKSTLSVTEPDGKPEAFSGSKDLAVKFWFQQLVLSALYRNDVESATSADWKRAVSSSSKIHGVYPSGSHIALPERQLVTFDEIVLPISEPGYPDFIYLRNGESYSRLAKYDPWLFWRLKVEVGLADEIPDTISRALF